MCYIAIFVFHYPISLTLQIIALVMDNKKRVQKKVLKKDTKVISTKTASNILRR
jgi:hypothetical protein